MGISAAVTPAQTNVKGATTTTPNNGAAQAKQSAAPSDQPQAPARRDSFKRSAAQGSAPATDTASVVGKAAAASTGKKASAVAAEKAAPGKADDSKGPTTTLGKAFDMFRAATGAIGFSGLFYSMFKTMGNVFTGMGELTWKNVGRQFGQFGVAAGLGLGPIMNGFSYLDHDVSARRFVGNTVGQTIGFGLWGVGGLVALNLVGDIGTAAFVSGVGPVALTVVGAGAVMIAASNKLLPKWTGPVAGTAAAFAIGQVPLAAAFVVGNVVNTVANHTIGRKISNVVAEHLPEGLVKPLAAVLSFPDKLINEWFLQPMKRHKVVAAAYGTSTVADIMASSYAAGTLADDLKYIGVQGGSMDYTGSSLMTKIAPYEPVAGVDLKPGEGSKWDPSTGYVMSVDPTPKPTASATK